MQKQQSCWFLKKSPGDLGEARGRLISQEDKQTVLKLISEACKSRARKSKAAQLLGLTIRTIQRWKQQGVSDKRKGSQAVPGNKLSDNQKAQIVKEHLHSSIHFVTPEDRHNGRDIKILTNRQYVYQEAKSKNPERWSGKTRNWNPAAEVVLKKFKRLKQTSEKMKKAS